MTLLSTLILAMHISRTRSIAVRFFSLLFTANDVLFISRYYEGCHVKSPNVDWCKSRDMVLLVAAAHSSHLLTMRPCRFTTPDLCPFGFGQRGWASASQFAPVISGNGLSMYKNPTNGQKTLVVTFSAMNSVNSVHNALKIGISIAAGNLGAPLYTPASAKLFLNRIGMDGARFLNPDRPGDLYISNFQFNANFIAFSNQNDAKIGVQVIQFTPDQLDASIAVDPSTTFTTVKYCPPSAGPFVSLDDVKNNRATSLRDMTIKVYNAADCSPTAPLDRTITIPHTRNACNRYNENATSARFFKIRCNAGEQYNSIRAANKYFFKDYQSEAACMNDGIDPIGSGLSLLSVGR